MLAKDRQTSTGGHRARSSAAAASIVIVTHGTVAQESCLLCGLGVPGRGQMRIAQWDALHHSATTTQLKAPHELLAAAGAARDGVWLSLSP